MENKALEFVRGFNSDLEHINQYFNLQLCDDGFSKGIIFPEVCLFSDDNDSTDFMEELTLSRLVKTLDEVLVVAKRSLSDKIDAFFAEKIKEAKEKFTYIKLKFNGRGLEYSVFVSGSYNEDILADFLDVVKEDFQYIFEGCKLDVEIK